MTLPRTMSYLFAGTMVVFGAFACGDMKDSSSQDTSGQNAAADDTTTEHPLSTGAGKTVTLGVFTLQDGTYTDTGRTLVFDVGVACFTWTRKAQPHDEYLTVHDHYNAADETSYIDDTITWTEYGPGHSQEEIDATCAAGKDGTVKTANSTTYSSDHGGNIYLRITKVE